MTCCSPNLKKWICFTISLLFLFLGIVTVLCWESIYLNIFTNELSLKSSETQEFKMWQKTPIPMHIEFYLYNFTNYNDVKKTQWKIKPKLEECGPYTFSELHIREAIQFNSNNTVTYKTKRIWNFLPEKSVGTLNDQITTINVILATIAYFIKDKNLLVQKAVDFFLKEKNEQFTVTKSVNEFIFEGYKDPMLDILHKINISKFDVPFDKFGWFYNRNGSVDYDGEFTMYNGADDINKLGRLTLWNGLSRTKNYEGNCGKVIGTSGELWYPIKSDETISIFSPDICSTINLVRDGSYAKYGLEGHLFVGDDHVFDNGTKYPEMACFSPGLPLPSGVRNVSQCKFGAPAFISFPHFYLADPYYINAVEGMKPNKSLHQFSMSIEPETGVPIKVDAAMQINILILNLTHISLLKDVVPTFIPALWFRQTATLTESLANQTKLLLILPSIGLFSGYGMIGIGLLILLIGIYITYKDGWKGTEQEHLLNHQNL